MKNRLIAYLAVFLLLASLVEGCAVINTMVSLKYETGYPGSKDDCTSSVTGANLCLLIKRHKAAAIGCLIGYAAIYALAAATKKPGE